MTLTDFLLARIAEDEALANAVIADMPRWDEPSWEVQHEADSSFPSERMSRQMSPARVLAECEAKRRIVQREADSRTKITFRRRMVLQDLASVYADHPDFRAEWAL